MHIRRALLLFAIVLGLAAVAASVSRDPEESGGDDTPPPAQSEPSTPTITAGDAPAFNGVREIPFDADRTQVRQLDAGQPASVLVSVPEAGLVEIPELGLSGPAEPLTPARFEVLESDSERLEITFTPASSDAPMPAGTLVVNATAEG